MSGSLHTPAVLDPRNDSLSRMLGGPTGWSVGVQKITHQLGFDLPTVQPITGRCTRKAILPMKEVVGIVSFSAYIHPLIETECGNFAFYGDTISYWKRMWVKFLKMQRRML